MAFNPLSVFQKNKRFWMAAILMLCMITFVFCTGQRGGIDQFMEKFIRRKGSAIFVLDGTKYAYGDVENLRRQRNLANDYMMRANDAVFRRFSTMLVDSKKVEKKDVNRAKMLEEIAQLRMSLAERKNKPRYFEGGTKLDDLVDFVLWQQEADRLGVRIEDSMVEILVWDELFMRYTGMARNGIILDEMLRAEFNRIEAELMRNQQVGRSFFLRALKEEFRVRMAQEAAIELQTASFMFRAVGPNQPFTPKQTIGTMPDEIRAPITLPQLWDEFRKKRAGFEVTLVPFRVDDYLKEVKNPDADAQRLFFDAHKNKPADPSSPDWGLELPLSVKIEYLMADPTSPAYVNMAKFLLAYRTLSPFDASPLQSPLATAARFVGAGLLEEEVLEKRYAEISQRRLYNLAAPYRSGAIYGPLAAWFAKDDPQAIAAAVGCSLMVPIDSYSAVTSYLAVGAVKHKNAIEAGAKVEFNRRVPLYASLFAASTSQFPLDMAAPFIGLDPWNPFFGGQYMDPLLPLVVVRKEVEESLTRDIARETAQTNIHIARRTLEKDTGQDARFKRDLDKLVPQLGLTYGPADKDRYYNRYSVATAKELAPLKEAFDRSVDMINFAEGRDMAPETLLKPSDFYKMFFDPTEPFSATERLRAMPWPPKVKTNLARAWKMGIDPRLINRPRLQAEEPELLQDFNRFLGEQDPNKPAKDFEGLFDSAEKPILFWRTGQSDAIRPADYSKLERDLEKYTAELKKNEEERKTEKDPANLERLKETAANLEKSIGDLKEIKDRVIEGVKFEKARETLALPKAKDLAQEIVRTNDALNILPKEADRLKKLDKPNRRLIVLPNLSLMQPQVFPDRIDYTSVEMPKDVFEYPRDDIMSQIVGLYDMQKPIKIDYKELDEINKELFEKAKKEKKPSAFVQILTNKPRSIYYVAVISTPPYADKREFASVLRNASFQGHHFGGLGGQLDLFVARAQEERGKQFRRQILDDMRREAKYEPPTDEARKQFDDRVGD